MIKIMRYPNARFVQSPNHNKGRREDKVKILALHVTDGRENLERAIEHLCKPENQVSAHFLIGQKGEVVQLVDTDDTAWHAKSVNPYSVGIEHCARSPGELSKDDPGLDFTEEQYLSSAKLVKWLLEQYELEIKDVLGHSEIKDSEGECITTHLDCPYKCIDKKKYFQHLQETLIQT